MQSVSEVDECSKSLVDLENPFEQSKLNTWSGSSSSSYRVTLQPGSRVIASLSDQADIGGSKHNDACPGTMQAVEKVHSAITMHDRRVGRQMESARKICWVGHTIQVLKWSMLVSDSLLMTSYRYSDRGNLMKPLSLKTLPSITSPAPFSAFHSHFKHGKSIAPKASSATMDTLSFSTLPSLPRDYLSC